MSPPIDPTTVKLAIETGGVAFRNPVLTASGTFGYGREFEGLTDLRALGGLVTKGISPAPRFGNATPRICETASGMLNSIGLENVGVEGFERDKLPYLRQCGTRVLVNFFGATFDEYVACGAGLDRLDGVDALEMNVSCPNIKAGGIEFGTDPRVLADLVRACRAVIKKPLWIKLTPNTSARQKFEVYPNMRTRGEYRTVLDLGLAVAITDRMQLTTGILHRYSSDPGVGLKRSDALFTTGIAIRFE